MVASALLLLALTISGATGYATGPPNSVCTDLAFKPTGHGAEAQTGDVPYTFEFDPASVGAGETLKVTIKSTDAATINLKGFLIVALPATGPGSDATDESAVMGTFAATTLNQAICTGGASHTSAFSGASPSNTMIELMWNAPANLAADVKFHATLVRQRDTFWVKESSAVVPFKAGDSVAEPEPASSPATDAADASTKVTSPATSDSAGTTNSGIRQTGLMIILADVLFWVLLKMWQ